MKKEIWKTVKRYEGLYEVSNMGRVKSLSRTRQGKGGGLYPVCEKILTNRVSGAGYFQIALSKGSKKKYPLIHRLVAQNFIPNPQNKPQVNHKNGIKTDNRVENLEWCTQSENQHHAYKIGLQKHQYGEQRFCSKLTENQVVKIKQMLLIGFRTGVIAKIYSVHSVTITDIKMGRTWVRA